MKSFLTAIVLGLVGTVFVFGSNILRERSLVRRKIGYMPDHFSMYRQMTVFEYLDFFGAAYGLGQSQRGGHVCNCPRGIFGFQPHLRPSRKEPAERVQS